MDEPWYSLRDLPLGRVHVRVVWNARIFPAVRALHPTTRRLTWCEYRGGEIVWLPPVPNKGGMEWSPEPERWQPLVRGKWGMPLPEPLPVQVVPQMSYMQTRFQSMSAADLAREMEESREEARARPEMDQQTVAETRWWRDITNIRYERAGEVSARMAEGRVMRAMAWCGAGSGLTIREKTTGTVLANLAEQAATEAAGLEDGHGLPRFQPLPQDHQDFSIAMAWVSALSPPETWHKRRQAWGLNRMQRVMLLRSLTVPLSYADIGHEFSISPKRARDVYAKAVESCWRVANGGRAREDIPVLDQIEALRERNRAHKRSATK